MTTPHGVWLIAQTPLSEPYPCRCVLGRRCRTWQPGGGWCCPCSGRTDLDDVPAHCCGRLWEAT